MHEIIPMEGDGAGWLSKVGKMGLASPVRCEEMGSYRRGWGWL